MFCLCKRIGVWDLQADFRCICTDKDDCTCIVEYLLQTFLARINDEVMIPVIDIHFFMCSGSLVLSVSQTEEKDMLWIMDPDLFPFKQTLMESHVSCFLSLARALYFIIHACTCTYNNIIILHVHVHVVHSIPKWSHMGNC